MKIAPTSTSPRRTIRVPGAAQESPLAGLPADAFDDRIAIVGTAGSGKTYAAKGFVERLLDSGARVAVVDPLGVWWGLRASADGSAPGYPVIVFGGKHADVPITSDMGVALGRIVAREPLVCVVDLSDLGSNAARRRFMAAFAEALYETNEEPLHLVHHDGSHDGRRADVGHGADWPACVIIALLLATAPWSNIYSSIRANNRKLTHETGPGGQPCASAPSLCSLY
jgi:Helicase HerA, central domain